MKFFRRRKTRQDLDQEVAAHLQLSTRDLLDRGASPDEAARAARREFGNVALVQNVTRDQWAWTWLDDLLLDFRYATRTLRKNPGFTVVAILTLALGIGANTAIFSVIDAVVLRPLPFANPDRLVWLNGKFQQSDEAAVSPPDFVDYRAGNQTFERLAAIGYGSSPASLSGDKPEQVLTNIATANFFDTLGIHPLLGRDFLPADERVNVPQVVILGHGLWTRAFGADPTIVGRTIRLDGKNLTVVGVLPVDLPLLSEAEIWQPTPLLNPGMEKRRVHFLKAIGRRKPNVTQAQADADIDSIAARLSSEYPDTNRGWTLRQRPLSEVLIGPVRPALLLISGAVGLLLLIACVNVANLLLARTVSRRREFAVRAALGASRSRMIRQTLTESVLLAVSGGALGVLGAIWGVHLLRIAGPSNLPRLAEIHINATVLLFTTGISLLTGVAFGLISALQTSGRGFTEALRESRRTSASGSHRRVGSALVVCEIAMSLTLLVGAGLLLKSFWLLTHVNPGFQVSHVVSARLSLNAPVYADEAARMRFWQQLEARVAALPGVEAVGATSELPLSGEHNDSSFYIEGHTYAPSQFDDANCRQITPGYLSAMRIPILAGRDVNEHDASTSAGVLVVNQAFARRFFHGQDAVGKRVRFTGDPAKTREIVGIAGNISHGGLDEPQEPEMYAPQFSQPTMHLVVRAAADPQNLAAALRDAVSGIDKDETLSAVLPMNAVVDASVAQPRFTSQLLGLFAALALLLAAIGLYGLMAYSVTQRTNEIGIRVALGASRSDVFSLVLRRGSVLTFAGIGIGLIASLFLTRLISSFLFGITATDPLTFAVVPLLLGGVAFGACYIPARRAMRVDPMVALRYE